MSEVGTALHRRAWETCQTCRRDMVEEGSTAAASTSVGSMAGGSMAVAVMAIHITTIKLVACPADRRRLNREACCRRVAVEEDSTVVAGNTAVAGMAIRITTIEVAARRIMEEGSTVEGSTVKGEG